MKLQEMIDAAFGEEPKPPAPQAPSEAFLERDRLLAVRAEKIENLRMARLTNVSDPAPAPLLFEVVRFRGHWRTRHGGKNSAALADQATAIIAARKLALAKRKLGHEVKVVLQRTDGREVEQALDDEPGQSDSE